MTIFNQNQIPEDEATDLSGRATDFVLLDVREADEWEAGRIPGAVWIPLGDLERARMEIPINKPVACICRMGGHSAKATEELLGWGFDAANLVGGMQAWAAAGLPVERDNGEPGIVI